MMACVKARHGLRSLALLLSSFLVMAACNAASSPASPSPTATRAAAKTSSCSAPPPLNATVRITSPKAGEIVAAGAVTVAFEVTGADLVAFQSAKCPNDYHVHVVLDRDVSAYVGTDVAAPLTADIKHTPFATSDEPRTVTFSGVAAGQHTTFAWLAYADHTSVKPAVSSSVTFVAR
jgi:hypothetical protein